MISYNCKQLQTANDKKGDLDMKLKYWIYQMKCKMKGSQDVDYIEFVARTLFTREGVRA